ncbi:hypothetical protein LCGC14_0729980 [marine sediment metagenome]|uniref:Uncharacterized protein n=1 Tax=marine sediment metagenome TaxID=412755 RepID=A0A0F9QV00_9ZZZZ
MTAENSYKATLEILKVLDKHEVSMKDAKIIFSMILDQGYKMLLENKK